MNIQSTFSSPNPVLFGVGASQKAGAKLRELGCKRVLLVFDSGIKAAGIVDKITGYIESEGITVIPYGDVAADVPDYSVNAAAEFALSKDIDGVAAVGGGSSLDTAKAVTVMLTNPAPISRYYTHPGMPAPCDLSALKPLVVLPTTAGTGSEVSPGGVIIDTENNTKEHIVCPVTLGIIDPELTLKLPASVTVMTAFDALCHAAEAVTSREPNVFSELFGLRAISLIAQNLPVVLKDGENLEARAGMHLAATLSTMSILGPCCHVPHDMGLVLGMDHNMPHGIAVSLALPEAMEFIAPAIPEMIKKVAQALCIDVPADAEADEIGKLVSNAIRELMRTSKLPSVKRYVQTKEKLLESIPRIMETQNFHFSPRPVTEEIVRGILSKAYDAAEEA